MRKWYVFNNIALYWANPIPETDFCCPFRAHCQPYYRVCGETPFRLSDRDRANAMGKQWQKQAVKMSQGRYRPIESKNPEKTRRSKRVRDKEPQQGTRIPPNIYREETATVIAG